MFSVRKAGSFPPWDLQGTGIWCFSWHGHCATILPSTSFHYLLLPRPHQPATITLQSTNGSVCARSYVFPWITGPHRSRAPSWTIQMVAIILHFTLLSAWLFYLPLSAINTFLKVIFPKGWEGEALSKMVQAKVRNCIWIQKAEFS